MWHRELIHSHIAIVAYLLELSHIGLSKTTRFHWPFKCIIVNANYHSLFIITWISAFTEHAIQGQKKTYNIY